MSRRSMEYGGCSDVTGAIVRARSSWATLKFETPIQRTFPAWRSLASSPHPSSTASSGSGPWIW